LGVENEMNKIKFEESESFLRVYSLQLNIAYSIEKQLHIKINLKESEIASAHF
jgi:phage anti-repressor protein